MLDEKRKGMYYRLIGKLIYLTLISLNITYAINVVSKFMHGPTDIHIQVDECILCCLKKNSGKGPLFMKYETIVLSTM